MGILLDFFASMNTIERVFFGFTCVGAWTCGGFCGRIVGRGIAWAARRIVIAQEAEKA